MENVSTATRYAGFWRRVVAAIIDGLILSVVTLPVTLSMRGDQAVLAPGVSAIPTLISWLYYALMESSARQATLGKMAIGIKVTNMQGARIGFGQATGRYFAKILSALILGIGFLMAAFTQRKQALHDFIAGTLVVMQ